MKKDKTTSGLFLILALLCVLTVNDVIKTTKEKLFRRAAGESDYERRKRKV